MDCLSKLQTIVIVTGLLISLLGVGCDSSPELVVSPGELDLQPKWDATLGIFILPTTRTITISNGGDGLLHWELKKDVQVVGREWLFVDKTSGIVSTSPDNITVTIDWEAVPVFSGPQGKLVVIAEEIKQSQSIPIKRGPWY